MAKPVNIWTRSREEAVLMVYDAAEIYGNEGLSLSGAGAVRQKRLDAFTSAAPVCIPGWAHRTGWPLNVPGLKDPDA